MQLKKLAPARLRDVPRAAWILSRAFASTSYLGEHIHPPALARLHALAPLPVFLVLTLAHTIARQVYLDGARVGAVIMGPRHTAREVLGWIFTCIGLIIVGSAVLTTIFVIASAPVALLVYTAGLAWVALAIEALFRVPLDKETRRELRRHRRKAPKGPRWTVGFLGKIPGTSVNASRLAHHLLMALPPDDAVVMVQAHTKRLHRQYARYGFTPTKGKSMYLEISTARNRRTTKLGCRGGDGESR